MTRLDPLRFAKFYATVKHVNNSYSGLPYTHHLAAVESVLRRFGVTPDNDAGLEMLIAAWLHDVVEDVEDVKVKDVAEMFGDRVAELVAAVTNESGENRKARAAATYPKIRRTPGATMLKLADRIANVEMGGKLVKMYADEYEDFRRALYTKGHYEDMWAHLDKLLLSEN